MKLAYLDGSSGISGDMFLAALLDAGLSPRQLVEELKKVNVGFYEFKRSRAVRFGVAGTRVEIRDPGQHKPRHLSQIEKLISDSTLSDSIKERAVKIFRRLAEVEGRLHNMPPEQVHFHEVGAVDAIIDIVGACAGLELLQITELVSSPLNVGSGLIKAEHGTMGIPAPATGELLKGVPVYSSGVEGELVTPTGAAIVTTLASGFGPMPAMKVDSIGYGAGEKDFIGHPNVARLFVGTREEAVKAEPAKAAEPLVSVLEANVDDMSPQVYAYFMEQALAAGALDVTCSPVQMKKNRPGLLVTIIAEPEKTDQLARLVFEQTTTIGLRIHEARRKVLERQVVTVETAYGPINVKVAWLDEKAVNAVPEYDDCQRAAVEKNVPLKQVILAAQIAYAQVAEKTPREKSTGA